MTVLYYAVRERRGRTSTTPKVYALQDLVYEFRAPRGPLDRLDIDHIQALRVGYDYSVGVLVFKRIRKPAAGSGAYDYSPRHRNPSHFKGRGIKHPAKRPVGRSMDAAMDWHEAGYGDALARRPSRSLDADYREGYSDGIRAREEQDSYGSFSDEKLYRSNGRGRPRKANGMIRRAASSAAGYAGRFAGGQAAGLQDALSDPEFMAALVAAGGAEVGTGGVATPVTGTVALIAFYRYWQRKKAREAAARAKAKTRKNGEPYEDYLILARAYRSLGQLKKAAEYERRARALTPGRSTVKNPRAAKAAKARKGTKVQSFVFDPARGWTVKLASQWVQNHGYTVIKTDRPAGGQIHIRIASPRTHQVVGTIPMGTHTGIQARVALATKKR